MWLIWQLHVLIIQVTLFLLLLLLLVLCILSILSILLVLLLLIPHILCIWDGHFKQKQYSIFPGNYSKIIWTYPTPYTYLPPLGHCLHCKSIIRNTNSVEECCFFCQFVVIVKLNIIWFGHGLFYFKSHEWVFLVVFMHNFLSCSFFFCVRLTCSCSGI